MTEFLYNCFSAAARILAVSAASSLNPRRANFFATYSFERSLTWEDLLVLLRNMLADLHAERPVMGRNRGANVSREVEGPHQAVTQLTDVRTTIERRHGEHLPRAQHGRRVAAAPGPELEDMGATEEVDKAMKKNGKEIMGGYAVSMRYEKVKCRYFRWKSCNDRQ